MKKNDITALVEILGKSVGEIANSQAENRDALLKQSLDEFQTTLLAKIEPLIEEGPPEPLRKGINHVAIFANALRDLVRSVEAIKTGRPSWMLDNNLPVEEVSPETIRNLDNFVEAGMMALRDMVNDSIEFPETEDDVVKAEAAGELMKFDLGGQEVFAIGSLPDDLAEFVCDPIDAMLAKVDLGRQILDSARDAAVPLVEMNLLPVDLMKACPEIFALQKADPDGDEDEDVGTGGDPDASSDPSGDPADNTDPLDVDPASMNPVELITRLASVIVVVAGSLMQGMDQSDANADDGNNDLGGDASGMPDDTTQNNQMPLQRRAPRATNDIGDIPLAKILAGEIEVHPSVADALEQLLELQKQAPALRKAADTSKSDLEKLQTTVENLKKQMEELGSQPGVAKGARMVVLGKSNDYQMPGQQTPAERAQAVADLAAVNPEAAAHELMKSIHRTGGVPITAPNGVPVSG